MTWPMYANSQIINGDETLSVVRQPQSTHLGVTYVGGKAVIDQAEIVTFDTVCTIQPLTGNDLMVLPEGDRFNDQFWVWTNQDALPLATGDLITRAQKVYECMSAENWGSYTRARMVFNDKLEAFVDGD